MSYTKLHKEMLDSTIWLEELHVKVVWITMLAMRDERHEVQASIPGLAKRAGVTLEQCQESLEKFMAPDPHSRSKEYDGRRIEPIRGGWVLLNGDYYQKRQSSEERRLYMRNYMRDKRQKERENEINPHVNSNVSNVKNVSKCNTVEKSRVKKSRVDISNKRGVSKATPKESSPAPLIFDAYLESWGKTKQYKLTPQRRGWINKALSSYGKDECLKAVEAFRNDDFADRSRFNDIKYLFGTQDRIDKWCGKHSKTNKTFDKERKLYVDKQNKIQLAIEMSKHREKRNDQNR